MKKPLVPSNESEFLLLPFHEHDGSNLHEA